VIGLGLSYTSIFGLSKNLHDPLLLDDGSAYATGNNPYGQISQNEEIQFQDNLKEAIIHQAL
jgi:hypothetical protein